MAWNGLKTWLCVYQQKQSLREKCLYLESFWSVYSRNRTEYRETLRSSPCSIRLRKNVDQNNSEYGHFLRSECNKIRHFSRVTKSRIFKNLNLRRKADRNFCDNLLKGHFRHLKFYSNLPSWLVRSCGHMSAFWKTKSWSSHFWDGHPFRFCYVGVHRQRRLKSTKAGISTQFKTLTDPETKNLVCFLWKKFNMRKFCSLKAKGFWFTN